MRNEKEIKNLMEKLNITREEAEELWDFDNGNCENETVNKLTEQAKTVKRYEKSDKPRKKATRERKVDEIKVEIIETVAQNIDRCCFGEDLHTVKNVVILKPEREIIFNVNGEHYSIILTKHRSKKK